MPPRASIRQESDDAGAADVVEDRGDAAGRELAHARGDVLGAVVDGIGAELRGAARAASGRRCRSPGCRRGARAATRIEPTPPVAPSTTIVSPRRTFARCGAASARR